MKAKKLMAALSAIVMSTAMCLSATGCKDEHKHSVADSDWVVTTAPTCETAGEATGKCSCGETLTKTVDALGHSYGNWEIAKPTSFGAGKAVKVCANDQSHKVEVDLPAINGSDKYTVAGSDLKKTFTYAHDLGNIEFTQYQVVDVAGAAGAAEDSADSVIRGNINYTNTKYSYDADNGVANPDKYDVDPAETDEDISYEFGDTCAHYIDGSAGTETWYDKTVGGIFSYMTSLNNYYETENKPVADATDDVFKGYSLGLTYYGAGHKEFGVERYIAYLYECALENPNKDFKEEVKTVEGKTVYSFSFSEVQDVGDPPEHIDPAVVLPRSTYLHVNEVSFTLNDDYIVETATITNTLYMILFNEEAPETSRWVATPQIEQAEDETWHVKDEWKGKPMNVETFTVTQKSELATGETKPVLPLSENDLKATSFELWTETSTDVKVEPFTYNQKSVYKLKRDNDGNIQYGSYSGETFTDEHWTPSESAKYEDATLSVDALTSLYFSVRNVAPATANLSFDEVKIYLRPSEGEDELLANTYQGGDDGHIKASFVPATQTISLNFALAGTHKIVVKTANFEKVVNVTVNPLNPTKLTPSVYSYNDVTEEPSWNTLIKDFTVYAGQPLYFTAQPGHPAYEVKTYTASVSGDATVELTDAEKGGVAVKKFVTDTAGSYTINIASTANSGSVTTKLRITVEAAPTVADLLNAKYENTDKTNELSLTLTASSDGATSGTASLLVDDNTTTFNYSYNDTDKTIAVTDVVGELQNVGLEITEGFKLLLTYTSGLANSYRVLLKDVNEVINELVGVHQLTMEEDAVELEVAVAGMYTISLPDGGLYKYSVNDGTKSDYQFDAKSLALEVGDKLKVFRDGEASVGEDEMFLITFKVIEQSGYGLTGTTWLAQISSMYSVTVTFSSEDSGTYVDSLMVSGSFTFTESETDGKHYMTFNIDNDMSSWLFYSSMVNEGSYFEVSEGKISKLVLTLDNYYEQMVTITCTKQ